MRKLTLIIIVLLAVVLQGCELKGAGTATRLPITSGQAEMLKRLISSNGVLLPYDISETRAKWRTGIMIDPDTLIVPVAAGAKGFFVATLHEDGEWKSEVVQTDFGTDLVTVVKHHGLAPSARSLSMEEAKKYVGRDVVYFGYNGERIIVKSAKLIPVRETQSDRHSIELFTPFEASDVGGAIFSVDGKLLGVLTDGPIKGGLSSFGLSAMDLQRLLAR